MHADAQILAIQKMKCAQRSSAKLYFPYGKMLNNIQKIWRDFAVRPFPDGCAGVKVEGIELTSLDTFAAACIDNFVSNNGSLDRERISILKQCAEEIEVVVPTLQGDAMDYFEQLHLLSQEVLRVVSKTNGGH